MQLCKSRLSRGCVGNSNILATVVNQLQYVCCGHDIDTPTEYGRGIRVSKMRVSTFDCAFGINKLSLINQVLWQPDPRPVKEKVV